MGIVYSGSSKAIGQCFLATFSKQNFGIQRCQSIAFTCCQMLFEQTGAAPKRSPVKSSDSSIVSESVLFQAILLDEKTLFTVMQLFTNFRDRFAHLQRLFLKIHTPYFE